MRKYWIGLIVVVVAIALGVAAAWGAVELMKSRATALKAAQPEITSPGTCGYDDCQGPYYGHRYSPNQRDRQGNQRNVPQLPNQRNQPEYDWNMPGPNMQGPMMRPWNNSNNQESGERISLDQAESKAAAYLSSLNNSDNLKVAEVMEFSGNFYVVVVEKDTGKGAFELLVDPYSGAVFSESGPNMMWNQKYGHMRNQATDVQNSLSLAEAKDVAQKALGNNKPGAEIEGTGLEFYGYYTFDYQIGDQIAGMLSVNGTNGNVWFHTWHGEFIAEKEY
jgi:hypothetical protein